MYSYMMGGDRIIRHIYGNIAGRAAGGCSTSAWGVDAKDPRIFWDSSKEFCKPMAMLLTRVWAGRSWCTPDAGRMRGGSSSMQSSSTPTTRYLHAEERRV